MRLRLLTALGTAALALAAPSAALAQHHGGGHHRHHGAKTRAHHAKFEFVRISAAGESAPTTTPPSTNTGTGPTTPPALPGEEAGTVVSYEKEILTIKLKDGSTVSGKVTADTHIGCASATAPPVPPSGEGGDQGQGEDQGDDSGQATSGTGQADGPGSNDHPHGAPSSGVWGEQQDGGDGAIQEGATSEPPCDTSSLTPGAVVRAAQLRIGPSGTVFEFVLLVR